MGEKTHKVGNSIPRIIFVALDVLLQVVRHALRVRGGI